MTETMRSLIRNPCAWVVFIALLIRFSTIGYYPLADTTEARYSEMARIMVETGNWLTPQFNYNVPFWGKPPLSIWVVAISFKVFGINEFAARLPSIFIAICTLFITFHIAVQQYGKKTAWIAVTFLSTNLLFFILSGAVLMDPIMTLGITLSMVSFWLAMKQRGRYWGYLFFAGLSIGLMSKGPVAVVLTGLPVFLWLLLTGNWRFLWQRIPLLSGSALMIALSVPWYLMAEQATPGFLEYFFIGEHWKRFTEPGWSGDLYGSAHTRKAGTIWLNWLVVAFPMSLIMIAALFNVGWRKKMSCISVLRESWVLYLVLWAMTPMVFFTFSGNILATYVLPGIPAAALLVAGFWLPANKIAQGEERQGRKTISSTAIAGLLIPLIYLWMILIYIPPVADKYSEKYLVEKYQQLNTEQSRLVYLNERPFSARFYSHGNAELLENQNDMQAIIDNSASVFFAIPVDIEKTLDSTLKSCLDTVQQFKEYTLFRADQQKCKH
ncbi:Polymyxin resistance protein ArnT, undecaprenyl phosphate-alpha-L-Ara4N transferase; Melittin resistance protein PqaB [hydrothermal vent metagenome]|uniref:Polymyxin resistance protein ArnT, undecaprenyl phosphate-alpha-L-Ara4N transferase Melittin resistance protein PqaB n=1 Tax=hydrothermal vent metagenome TaxID=652676 RepID=A0A3B0X5W2_9ZZZZ